MPTASVELLERIRAYEGRPDDLIAVLHLVQEELGHIPSDVQEEVAAALGVPISRVYGVVTFYHFFRIEPVGQHTIRLCLGTACHVRGVDEILRTLQTELGVAVGETTQDRLFTLEAVRCLGTCGLAPVMMVDDDVYGRLTRQRTKDILESYRSSAGSES
ncbi:MAG: NADH-quinone oxidoreductase subunit NuoE [Acidimicrobiia bacterium]|nr:NADH-quinone oxidoreductase subunit NuoE [Acidimicrobiia bacterium]